MIKVTVKELIAILTCTPPEQNIMLVGRHGIGKSQILVDFYENNIKIPVVSFFLGRIHSGMSCCRMI